MKWILLKKESKILDLGCGKGAVLINLVKNFGCQGHGIDALPDFIEEAKEYAKKNKVEQKCTFETGDIRRMVDHHQDYDLVIDPESLNLAKELNNYAYSHKKSGTLIDNFNHLLDALRYSVSHQLMGNGKIEIR